MQTRIPLHRQTGNTAVSGHMTCTDKCQVQFLSIWQLPPMSLVSYLILKLIKTPWSHDFSYSSLSCILFDSTTDSCDTFYFPTKDIRKTARSRLKSHLQLSSAESNYSQFHRGVNIHCIIKHKIFSIYINKIQTEERSQQLQDLDIPIMKVTNATYFHLYSY